MKIPLYNPLTRDFSVKYDINEDKNPKEFTIKAGEIQYFPKRVANHIKKHLARRMLEVRGYIKNHKGNAEASIKEYEKEIEVKLDE